MQPERHFKVVVSYLNARIVFKFHCTHRMMKKWILEILSQKYQVKKKRERIFVDILYSLIPVFQTNSF